MSCRKKLWKGGGCHISRLSYLDCLRKPVLWDKNWNKYDAPSKNPFQKTNDCLEDSQCSPTKCLINSTMYISFPSAGHLLGNTERKSDKIRWRKEALKKHRNQPHNKKTLKGFWWVTMPGEFVKLIHRFASQKGLAWVIPLQQKKNFHSGWIFQKNSPMFSRFPEQKKKTCWSHSPP